MCTYETYVWCVRWNCGWRYVRRDGQKKTDTQAISTTTKNKKYVRFETECRVETTLSHKDMTQLENLIHGYKMMNIRKWRTVRYKIRQTADMQLLLANRKKVSPKHDISHLENASRTNITSAQSCCVVDTMRWKIVDNTVMLLLIVCTTAILSLRIPCEKEKEKSIQRRQRRC